MRVKAQDLRTQNLDFPQARTARGARSQVRLSMPDAPHLSPRAGQTAELPIGRPRTEKREPLADIVPKVPLSSQTRTFARVQGPQHNEILVAPEAQAHVVVDNHPLKRHVVMSQPAGNVGAGWWWSSSSVKGFEAGSPEAVVQGNLRGTKLTLTADANGSVRFEAPILDSVRAIRDRLGNGEETRVALREKGQKAGLVPEDAVKPRAIESSSNRLVLERSSISGSHKHRLEMRAMPGTTISRSSSGEIEISSKGKPAIEVSYLTDLAPLTPFAPLDFLNPAATARLESDLERAQQGQLSKSERHELRLVCRALEDLSAMVYREKAIAGGWRFLTYFGRDTLQTVMMLRPVLDPEVVESVFQAALERTGPKGDVAHEEDLADQAEHVNLRRALSGKEAPDRAKWSEPVYDYKMVDDDFMLASAVAEYLTDPSVPEDRKKAFLEKQNATGEKNVSAIQRNLAYIADRAAPYAESVRKGQPDPKRLVQDPFAQAIDPKLLIKINDGEMVGDWRDSDVGLALGKYPASINLELVPTSLEKAGALSEKLGAMGYAPKTSIAPRYNHGESPAKKLSSMAEDWKTARSHFLVKIPAKRLPELLGRFLDQQTKDGRELFSGLELGGMTIGEIVKKKELPPALADGWTFSGVSLDADAKPVAVMSSDGFFGLSGSTLRREAVKETSRLISTPYPLGLATPAGAVVSNPVLAANEKLDDLMGPGRYHGAVIWTWLEALGMSALAHQRNLANEAGEKELARAADDAIRAIDRQVSGSGELQTSELHGWDVKKGNSGLQIVAKPFEGAANETLEAWPGNATQLWATALPLVRWAYKSKLL
jgi:hypothetical protein